MDWQEFAERFAFPITVASVLVFIAGLVAMRYVVIYVPSDYFVRKDHDNGWWFDQHPAVRWSLRGLKNLMGAIFLALGVIMLMVPGPGVMSLLVGLWLIDVPGKRRAEQWLISFPAVYRKINEMRAKRGKGPLKLPNRIE